ncbi:hypothetical protein [Streptomyces sp. BK022]|uniref:hypothetical protein n=1 Tax=Streptomyces sp. BK022 TaxID=2512123 RepID=UPI001029887B|nr:hypothetical protein [Streptomyces sp. BK022]
MNQRKWSSEQGKGMTMGKLTLRMASAATSVMIAGGVLFAAGGSASAAVAPVGGHGSHVITAEHADESGLSRRHITRCEDPYSLDSRYYPWVYDQLVQFRGEVPALCHG